MHTVSAPMCPRETLSLTTLGQLQVGQAVNLELAMGLDARLGGHLVTGHVDGKARLLSRRQDARSERFEFEVPVHLSRYIAKKGSACLDGVSLTVNEVDRTVIFCVPDSTHAGSDDAGPLSAW